ncbi:unnamed protein product [Rotaria sp. Silwood2]|nr:unnamed protein product [Rotaria sp. Silwood2]
MGSRKTNSRERQLQEVINEGYVNCIDDDSTTFEKNDYEEKIDRILASQPLHSLISNVETHSTIGTLSGHKPLTFDIPIGTEPKSASPRLSLNFKAANWSKFRSKLNEQLMLWNKHRHITSAIDIEEYTSFITNSIKSATQEAIPTSKQLNTNIRLNKQHPSSYRPISLLSCLGKLLEKIIKQRLMVILERRNILPEHQAGFRPRQSTLNNIIRLTKYAQNHLHSTGRRRHATVILFDIKAAFDSVWHDGLIYKLNELRLPQYLTNCLISFVQNRTAAIEIENTLSRPFNLNSGIPFIESAVYIM